VPVALVPATSGHKNLLIVAFLLGMAGSSFAVCVGYVSRWFSMESQGSARSAVKWKRRRTIKLRSSLPE
jgi:nitrate/nitrite transporter NarK